MSKTPKKQSFKLISKRKLFIILIIDQFLLTKMNFFLKLHYKYNLFKNFNFKFINQKAGPFKKF